MHDLRVVISLHLFFWKTFVSSFCVLCIFCLSSMQVFLTYVCMISDIIMFCIIVVYIMYKTYEVLCDFFRNLQKREG